MEITDRTVLQSSLKVRDYDDLIVLSLASPKRSSHLQRSYRDR
jgi:hypothetical protein